MIELADQCRNQWRSLLPMCGVDASFLKNSHGPCPMCGGKDRFRFDDQGGRGTYYCNACGAGDGIRLLQKLNGWSFQQVAERLRAVVGDFVPSKPDRPRRDPMLACRDLWGRAQFMRKGDHAWRYLAARGLSDFETQSLRYIAECPISRIPGRTVLPALLAKITAPDGSSASIHRTYLGDGAKADIDEPRRLMPGSMPKGSAIRLRPYGGILGVAEGIETALAVWLQFRIPCWSTVNATMLRDFVWPEDIAELHIFGDNDRNYAGQAAAYHLANRAMVFRRPVRAIVHIPPTVGEDWLDHHVAHHVHAA